MRLYFKIMLGILITLAALCLLGTIYVAFFGNLQCITEKCTDIRLLNIPTYFYGIVYYLVLLFLTIKIYTSKKILFVKSCTVLALFGMFIALSFGMCIPCLIVLGLNGLYFVAVINFLRSINVRV